MSDSGKEALPSRPTNVIEVDFKPKTPSTTEKPKLTATDWVVGLGQIIGERFPLNGPKQQDRLDLGLDLNEMEDAIGKDPNSPEVVRLTEQLRRKLKKQHGIVITKLDIPDAVNRASLQWGLLDEQETRIQQGLSIFERRARERLNQKSRQTVLQLASKKSGVSPQTIKEALAEGIELHRR